MANIKNLDDYLKNDATVKSAKKKLDKAKSDLTTQTYAKNAVKEGTPSYADVMVRYNKALDASNTAQSNFDSVTRNATQFFNTNKESILAKTKAADAKTDQERLTDARATKDRLEAAGQSTVVLDKSIKDLQDKIAGTGKYAPKESVNVSEDVNNAGGTDTTGSVGNVSIEDFLRNLDTAGIDRINEVKTYLGIKNLDGKLDYPTINAIIAKEKEILVVSDATGRPVDRLTYYKTAPKSGTGDAVPTATISSPTAASALINSVFQSELGRDANASEIQKYTLELNAAERKNPSKTVKGITSGGLNKTEFLTQVAKKLPEFAQKKTDKAGLTSQSLLGTAKANGITLGQDQINNFTQQIQNGTDIRVIQNQIRSIASLGMPDNVKKLLNEGIDLETVFSPYKRTMAAILELNPETIDLNDPTLRMAMGGDYSKVTSTPGMGGVSRGEYTMYDFEKALRKDYRWQYTDNAKRDVSNVALKVLQDFGFQA